MADIPETALVSSLTAVASQANQKKEKNKEQRTPSREGYKHPPLRESVSDVIYIMGIPAEEVTDKIREAIALIVNELDYQREQLKFANEKIESLEKLSEIHSFLPLINYRGFLRELARVIIHKERTRSDAGFLFINIQGVQNIRSEEGHKAAQMALAKAAKIISENVLNTDIVGSLGGDGIGVILTVAGQEEVAKKTKELIQALQDNDARLQASIGVHVARAGETASEVIEAANKNLRMSGLENNVKRRRRVNYGRRRAPDRRQEDASGDDIG